MKAFLACLLLVLLAACGSGPDADLVRESVEHRLAQALPDGSVKLHTIERRGSQADTKAPAGEERRIVYFDAELQLTRDIDFAAWNAPGVAGLVSALGAGPKGIEGIRSGGNKANDIIRAHGTVLYRQEAGTWQAVMPAGYQPPVAPGVLASTPERTGAMLTALRKVVEAFPRDTSPEQYAAIEEELAAAQASIRARLARASNGYAIAAGAEHGQYLRVARALFSGMGSRAVPLITRGGEENLRLLRSGKVSLALAQGDAALDAYEGTGAFAGQGPHIALRGVTSLYPEPLHVLVRADSKLNSIADLRRKRVAIGQIGAASRTTAIRVLQAHGIALADIEPLEFSINGALLALQQNETDAVLQVIGTPADSVRDSLIDMPLRMLSLDAKAISALTEEKKGYFPFTIQKGTYVSQTTDVQTIATAALLLTDTAFSDAEIASLTRRIFEKGTDYSALGSTQGAQISVATSRVGLSVPMHVAAAKVLEGLAAKDGADTGPREKLEE
ncbi:TAXI family TRAP transporter solute-binding subunit [Pusillimonas sp. ANT_WB101]|uniref:TAXI family TRAP transporter solute-binding subunit n=1 Tax=Pusillimonas sp. ANT_WB101 TaxID=2597356 RepID=UPI0011EE9032|nr:TAXI family TRAP transporter solute-binding subunit [Pusillimonas sp. ANT_WB101]KAA0892913.1 TAXI family TRAP transporter solute-binding subunit [Pusillimonas sp. ANT_WB101]